jgi:sterol desaturase/sphingolipid hydroxylase (fatty acid hydroxylase superfamily)
MTDVDTFVRDKRGDWRPPGVLTPAPVFIWPARPLAAVKWLFGYPGYLFPWQVTYAAIATITWLYLTPTMATMKSMDPAWIAFIFVRNLGLLTLIVSAWHIRLYVQKAQGTDYKYSGRWLARDNPTFLFGNQVLDNIFWTMISAVPIWTAYEVVTLWAFANGYIPYVDWIAHPIYCFTVMLLIQMFHELHFYLIHRLIHWPPLYRAVHNLHHKNAVPGPWSGLAMHPVEHLLYFSGVLVHWIVPSHPLHAIFHLQTSAFGPAQGHSGFERVVINPNVAIKTGDYYHYLHHKFFECNYGSEVVPVDKWFGTFHDGSAEAEEVMNKRFLARRR